MCVASEVEIADEMKKHGTNFRKHIVYDGIYTTGTGCRTVTKDRRGRGKKRRTDRKRDTPPSTHTYIGADKNSLLFYAFAFQRFTYQI